MSNVECRRVESLRSVFILNGPFDTEAHDRQNTLFDVRCWTFDVRCSLVSFSIRLAAFQASGWADSPTLLALRLVPSTCRVEVLTKPEAFAESEAWKAKGGGTSEPLNS